ncbi:MAG: hypothetical protein H6842_14125 [Rhodospirillaceae bacterium]|nr:hypothetical protein [Rhodospirillaceae bacterium]
MIRMTTAAWWGAIAVAGGALFHISYQVERLESERHALDQAIEQERQSIRILRAEWAYLNQPERLAALAENWTDLEPMRPDQLIGAVTDIPLPLPAGEGGDEPTAHLVHLADLPGFPAIPLPAFKPVADDDRRPAPPPTPAGDAVPPPPLPAPPTVRGGGTAPPLILAGFRSSRPTLAVDGAQ